MQYHKRGWQGYRERRRGHTKSRKITAIKRQTEAYYEIISFNYYQAISFDSVQYVNVSASHRCISTDTQRSA